MVKEVIWTPLAVETFDNIIEYLSGNFGETAVKHFVQSVDTKIKLIQFNQDQECLGLPIKEPIRISLLLEKGQPLLIDISLPKIKLN